jgi:Tfp pilus assembly protein PilN
MIKLNLLPPPEKKEFARNQFQRWIIFYGVRIIGILLIFSFLLAIIWLYIDIQLQAANKDYNSIQTGLRGTDLKMQQEKTVLLNTTINKISLAQKNQKNYSGFLASLTNLVPPGIRLEAISLDKNNEGTLNGFAQKREQIIAYKDLLDKSGLFVNIENPLSNLVKQTDINFYFKFKIVLEALNK